MKNLYTLLFLVLTTFAFSQSNFTVFNNGGQQFYVILNGIKQNSKPMTNVSVSGIKNGSYSVKLIFADGKTPDIDKNFFIEEPSDITTRVVFKKGKGKLQLIGMEPTKGTATENVIIYRPDNNATYSDNVVVQTPVSSGSTGTVSNTGSVSTGNVQQVSTGSSSNTVSGSTTTQTTTQTTGSASQPGNTGMNININVQDPTMNGGQGGINMSVNMSGTGTTQQTTQSTQTTQTAVTTTTTGSATGGQQLGSQNTSLTNTGSTNVSNQSSNGPVAIKCVNILSDEKKEIAAINTLIHEDDKKDMLVKDLEKFCLTAIQGGKFIELFVHESNKLEVAEYLYLRTIDKDVAVAKYMSLFTHESTKEEFREFTRTVK